MKRQRHYISSIVTVAALLLTLILGAPTAGQNAATPKLRTISLGLVSAASQKEIEEHFHSFARYVATRLSSTLEIEGRVVVAPTALQLAKLLEEKRVDFYMESAYPTYVINRQGAAAVVLRRWKSGLTEYRGLIFAKSGSGTLRPEDLRGKMIAFEDPGSTSGYFLPKLFLLRKGFRLVEKPGPEAKVAPGEVGYIFASSYVNTVDLVLSKRIAAGAFSSDDYGAIDDKQRAEIIVLAETETFPRHLVSTRKDLEPTIKNRLKDILLSMHQDEEGRGILKQIDNTTKFDLLPGGEEMMRRNLVELFRPRRRN
jgi:phosphonate transport system substrate-binding protein